MLKAAQHDVATFQALAIARILVLPFWLALLATWGRGLWMVGLPTSMWDPLPLAQFLDGPPPLEFIGLLWWLALLGGLAMAAGLATRASTLLAAVSGVLLGSVLMSFGKISHSSQVVLLFVGLMAFSDWGTAWSIDAWRRRRWHPSTRPAVSGVPPLLPVYGFIAVLGVWYAASALHKMGGTFLEVGHMAAFLTYGRELAIQAGAPSPAWVDRAIAWLATHPRLAWLLSLGAIAMEFVVLLGMLSPRLAVGSMGAVMALHGAIGVLSPLRFVGQAIVASAAAVCFWPKVRPPHSRGVVAETRRRLHPLATMALGAVLLAALLLAGRQGIGGGPPAEDAVALLSPLPNLLLSFWLQAAFFLAGTALLLGMATAIARDALVAARGPPQDRVTTALLYDGLCGFCKRWCDWAARRTGQAVSFQTCQESEELRQLASIPDAACLHAAHFVEVDAEGRMRHERGAGAINAVLERFQGRRRAPWRLLGRVYRCNGIRQAQDLGYRLVAANRHRFGDDACAVPVAPPPSPPLPPGPPQR